MFILYFALWVVLNGRWTTEIGAFGVAFAAIAYLFTCKFMGYSLSLDFALLKRAPHAIRYVTVLFIEIVKANLAVMRMVLDRGFEPQPHLVQFDVNLKKERHRVALANSITLTPGTITVNLDENHYVVHCLDTSMIDGLDHGDMVVMLEEMERLHMAQDLKAAHLGKEPAMEAEAAENAVESETAAENVIEAETVTQNMVEEEADSAARADDATQAEKEEEHEH